MKTINILVQATHPTLDGADLDAAIGQLRDAAEAAGYSVLVAQRQAIPEPVQVA